MIAPVMGLIFFILIAGGIVLLRNQAEKEKYIKILTGLADGLKASHTGVCCSTFGSGAKNSGYIFNRCNIHLTEDAIILFGYFSIGRFKMLCPSIILTTNLPKYHRFTLLSRVISPRKLNVNSFNKEVFMEFGEAGWRTTNVEIRLKGLTDEEKSMIAQIGKGVGTYRAL